MHVFVDGLLIFHDLSTKGPVFMDRLLIFHDLSTKGPVFVDKERSNCERSCEIADGIVMLQEFFYLCRLYEDFRSIIFGQQHESFGETEAKVS